MAGALLGVACSSDPLPPAELAIGVKPDGAEFIALADGAEVEVAVGPQGGVMLGPALRAWDIDPGDPDSGPSDSANPEVHWTLTIDGAERGGQAVRLPMTPVTGEAGLCELDALYIQISQLDVTGLDDFLGTPTVISVELEDADGRTGAAAVTVIPVAPATP